MRTTAIIWMILTTLAVLLISATAGAETPPTPASANAHEDMTSDLIRSASARVAESFQMIFFENEKTGSKAFFSLEPDFNPGCKVKLTLRF